MFEGLTPELVAEFRIIAREFGIAIMALTVVYWIIRYIIGPLVGRNK